MTWFTENPWPLVIPSGIACIISLALWSFDRQKKWLMSGTVALLFALGVYLCAASTVTESEKVMAEVRGVVEAFTKKERERTLNYFSPQAPDLRQMCDSAMVLVEIPNGLDVKDMSVKMTNENSRAVVRFRANGTAGVRGMGSQHVATRWELTWQKTAGEWKIVGVQRLHPYKDEKLDAMEPRQN